MALPIAPVNLTISPIVAPAAPSSAGATGGAAFQSAFAEAVSKVEAFQQNSQASINSFLSGDGEELHQVAIKTQEAELSFDLFLQMRNKVVAAYQEIMRMQV
jgi:flagellar hook-basal body complex protein FliE